MDILQAAQLLRPGTAWNLRGDVLEQALDNTPRVSVPSQKEINTLLADNPTPVVKTLEQRITDLEAKIADAGILEK